MAEECEQSPPPTRGLEGPTSLHQFLSQGNQPAKRCRTEEFDRAQIKDEAATGAFRLTVERISDRIQLLGLNNPLNSDANHGGFRMFDSLEYVGQVE